MLAKTRVFKRRREPRGLRSPLGARLARPQSIIVYLETEPETPPDPETHYGFCSRANRLKVSMSQSSGINGKRPIFGLNNATPFLTRFSRKINPHSLS